MKMTLFYSKRTGEIKNYMQGYSDMGFFGNDEGDYSQIYDFIITDNDDYVLANIEQFEIIEGQIKLKNVVNLDKYL